MVIGNKEIYELCLIPTERCNLNCRYCMVDKSKGGKTKLSVAFAAIDEMMFLKKNFDGYTISFMGGEPFLNFNFIRQVVSYVDNTYPNKTVFYEIVTNGTLLTAEIKAWIKDNINKLKIVLSLDGDKKTQDIHRCNSFDLIDLEFFKRLPSPTVNMVITPTSLQDLVHNLSFLDSNGFSVRAFIEEGTRWKDEHMAAFAQTLKSLVDFYIIHPDVKICSLLRNSFHLLEDDDIVLGCSSHKYSYAISAEGIKYECHRCLPYENTGEIKIPNASLKELSEFRLLKDKCRECYISKLCNSCPATNAARNGNAELIERRCMMNKIIYKAQAYLFSQLLVTHPNHAVFECLSKKHKIGTIVAIQKILQIL